MRYILIAILFTAVSSCSLFKPKKDIDKDVIAAVNNEYLYASEIPGVTHGLTGKDSIEALKNYAETWVRKKLLLQKAKDNIAEDDAGITRKIEDYRETLLLYEYEKALIDSKLDTALTQQEMDTTYERMKNDFPLQNDVYLVRFIKLNKEAPDFGKAKKWILNPKDDEERAKLEGYCREFALSYSADGVWYEKAVMLKNFPIAEYDLQVLSNGKQYREYKEGDVFWFLKVTDVLKKDEPSPLAFVKENIEKAILEKRRTKLLERTYHKIYQDGLSTKAFEIYIK